MTSDAQDSVTDRKIKSFTTKTMDDIDKIYCRRRPPRDGFWEAFDKAEQDLARVTKQRPLTTMQIEAAFLKFRKAVLGAL